MADDVQIRRTTGVMAGAMAGETSPSVSPFISWRSIFAGFLISVLCFAILMSLGMGIGGVALSQVLEGPGNPAGGWSTGAALWTAVSIVLSLAAGSYFAGRASSFVTARVGAAQGLVIASLFFVLFFYQVFSAIGWAGRTTASAVGGAANMAGSAATRVDDLAQQLPVQDIMNQVFANLNIENPQAVGQGVLQRVLAGNFDSATSYLAREANIPVAEAQRRLTEVQGSLNGAIESAATSVANVMSGIGWSLFVLTLLGACAGALGGGLGSRENRRHPITAEARDAIGGRAPLGV